MRMKMKRQTHKVKTSILLLLTMLLVILTGVSVYKQKVFAADSTTKQYVVDNAGIFTGNEVAKLQAACEKASQGCKTDIVIMTMRQGLDGDTLENYIRNIIETEYGFNGTGKNADAVVYVIDMKSRVDRIITSGNAKTDTHFQSKLDGIRATAENQLKNSKYYDGCSKYIDGVERVLNRNIGYRLTLDLPIKIGGALVLAIAVVLIMMYHAKSRMTVNGNTYTRDHQCHILGQDDQYINTTVVTRHIQRDNGNNSTGGGGGGNSGSSSGHF